MARRKNYSGSSSNEPDKDESGVDEQNVNESNLPPDDEIPNPPDSGDEEVKNSAAGEETLPDSPGATPDPESAPEPAPTPVPPLQQVPPASETAEKAPDLRQDASKGPEAAPSRALAQNALQAAEMRLGERLDAIEQYREVTVKTLAAVCGSTVEDTRRFLDSCVRDGLVHRLYSKGSGRYSLTPVGAERLTELRAKYKPGA